MMPSGLRLDQAPPFSVPLRFFLTAPLFPVLAAAMLAWQGPEVLATRWSPAILTATHWLTLGFLTMVMIGAFLQLLPVLASAPLSHPRLVGGAVHGLLTLGALALGGGFAVAHATLMRLALGLLSSGFTLFIVLVAFSLARAPVSNPTVNAMRLALVALSVTVALGVGLGFLLNQGSTVSTGYVWTNLHLAWGLIGWVSVLVMGVAYQVVPMFQLTPHYPAWLRSGLVPTVFGALIAWSLSALIAPLTTVFVVIAGGCTIIIAGGLATFALTTWRLQWRRRRHLPDITTRFWQLAMGCLMLSVALGLATGTGAGNDPRLALLLGVWLIVGFASSVVHGMLYKIVPFLVWMHLHARQIRYTLPNMKEILPDTRTMPHLWLHGAALLLLSAAVIQPSWWIYPAMAAMALTYAWLGWNLWSAYLLYWRTVRATGGRA